MKKLQVPTGHSTGRIVCPECGNDKDFVEVAENVIVTSRYFQNNDGSFTPEESDTEIQGEVKLFCGLCDTDLSLFHSSFIEMIF